jgi:hypothetical protein
LLAFILKVTEPYVQLMLTSRTLTAVYIILALQGMCFCKKEYPLNKYRLETIHLDIKAGEIISM